MAYVAVKDAEDQRASAEREKSRGDSLVSVIRTILAREKVMMSCTTADKSHICSGDEFEAAEQARDSLRAVFSRTLGTARE